jgi:spore cortex biosynthesis protein YabQ
MDTARQFSVFILCICYGYLSGIIYEVFALFRLFFRSEKRENIIGILLDISFFILFSVGCVYFAYLHDFPTIRIYMWIGCALGGVLYWKTLRRILAFLEKVCYNSLAKIAKKAKTKKKLLKERGNL